jgi:hypothetical protein
MSRQACSHNRYGRACARSHAADRSMRACARSFFLNFGKRGELKEQIKGLKKEIQEQSKFLERAEKVRCPTPAPSGGQARAAPRHAADDVMEEQRYSSFPIPEDSPPD